jgi:hypothetical protein
MERFFPIIGQMRQFKSIAVPEAWLLNLLANRAFR